MGPIVRSQIRSRRSHANRRLSRASRSRGGCRKYNSVPWWFTDIAGAVNRPAALIPLRVFLRVYADERNEGRFRGIALNAEAKRSSPFSRFVYFYAKPRGISLRLCSPGTRVHSFITAAVSFPSHLFISPLLPFFRSVSSLLGTRDAFPVSSRLVRSRRDLRGTKGELPFSRQRE